MSEACKQLGTSILGVLNGLCNNTYDEEVMNKSFSQLQNVSSLADTINTSLQGATPENLLDLLENEMLAMDKAIEEAANVIQVYAIDNKTIPVVCNNLIVGSFK